MKHVIAIVACLFIAACGGMPKHADVRADQVTTINITNGPAGAAVIVDGAVAGYLGSDGAKFVVTPGTRHVEVSLNGQVIYDRKIFIDSGTTREIVIGS